MEQQKKHIFLDYILIIFLIIQPIFDLKIFYNSISTLIRVIIILGLFICYFIKSNNNKKYLLISYPIILSIYFVFHHLNALNFKSLVPGDFNYSILKEALYFLKMISPFLLIYALFKSSLNKYDYIKIIKSIILIIGCTIILSNIFMFSYGSYSNSIIKANFFAWFNTDYSYTELASKGLFEYANQIGAVLIMYLPFAIISTLKSKNNKEKFLNILILIINIFSLILLCTRVSVLGIILVFAYTIFAFILINLIYSKRKNKSVIVSSHFAKKYIPIITVFAVYIILLPINPMFNRLDERNNTIETFSQIAPTEENTTVESTPVEEATPIAEENIQTNITSELEQPNNDNNFNIISYIENNYKRNYIPEQFLFINYPYQYDPEFWYNILQEDISLTTDYRYIEKAMVKRVVDINNNSMDFWFGITNTRLQNIFNIEKDFVVQYYALGIIGLILVFFPYFALLAYFIYKIIRAKLKNLTLINTLSFITIIFLFAISYFSGNLLNSLSFSIYFTLLFKLMFI